MTAIDSSRHASFGANFRETVAFWERRRIVYNLLLAVVVIAWIAGTWPHFRPAFTLANAARLFLLGFLAGGPHLPARVAACTNGISSGQMWGNPGDLTSSQVKHESRPPPHICAPRSCEIRCRSARKCRPPAHSQCVPRVVVSISGCVVHQFSASAE